MTLNNASRQKQRGVVLILALVFLLILTIAGMSAMRLANVEEKMTGNFGDRNLAFQAAEAALTSAENAISDANYDESRFYNSCNDEATCFEEQCVGGLCFDGTFDSNEECVLAVPSTKQDELFQDPDVWENTDRHIAYDTQLSGIDVKYIIEFRCYAAKDPSVDPDDLVDPTLWYSETIWEPLYRITAFAEGRTGSSRVMLQSTYRRD